MTREEIFEQVQQLFVETFELEKEDVSLYAHLYNDLDLDSFDAIELAIKMESDSGIKLEEDDLRAIQTISDVIDLIDQQHNP